MLGEADEATDPDGTTLLWRPHARRREWRTSVATASTTAQAGLALLELQQRCAAIGLLEAVATIEPLGQATAPAAARGQAAAEKSGDDEVSSEEEHSSDEDYSSDDHTRRRGSRGKGRRASSRSRGKGRGGRGGGKAKAAKIKAKGKKGRTRGKAASPADAADAGNWDTACGKCSRDGNLLHCNGCVSSFHATCVGLRRRPRGDFYCPACAQVRRNTQNVEPDEDEWDSTCSVCVMGGDLMICEGCPRAFHPACLGLKVRCWCPGVFAGAALTGVAVDVWPCRKCRRTISTVTPARRTSAACATRAASPSRTTCCVVMARPWAAIARSIWCVVACAGAPLHVWGRLAVASAHVNRVSLPQRCVKLKQVPEGDWMCPLCKEKQDAASDEDSDEDMGARPTRKSASRKTASRKSGGAAAKGKGRGTTAARGGRRSSTRSRGGDSEDDDDDDEDEDDDEEDDDDDEEEDDDDDEDSDASIVESEEDDSDFSE